MHRPQGGWAGPSDGFLAIDANGSGAIDQPNEITFTQWDENARTDLEGLKLAFDTNSDGVFDAQDERFAEFLVWQDDNGDRVSQAGEMKSLANAGISSIDLSGVPYEGEPVVVQEKAGNRVFGVTTIAYDDGSFGIAGDVALASGEVADETEAFEGDGGTSNDEVSNSDEAITDSSTSDTAVEQLSSEVAALTSKIDQLVSEMAAFGAEPAGCSSNSHLASQKFDHTELYAANSQAA